MTAGSTTPELHTSPVPRTRVRFPLRAKITIPYLLLAIGLAIGAGYVVMRIVFDTTDERFSNQLIETGKLSAEWMVREENRLLKTLRILTFTEGMEAAIRERDVQRLSELAVSVAVAQGEEEVFLLDANSAVLLGIAREQGNTGSPYLIQDSNGTEFSALPFVKKVFSGDLDTQGDKYSGIAMHNGDYYFYVSGPLRDAQEIPERHRGLRNRRGGLRFGGVGLAAGRKR